MESLHNFIDGQFVPAASGATLPVTEPATGVTWSQLSASGATDVGHAVDAAYQAFPAWSRRPAGERSALLLAMADGIEARAEEFAQAESRDTGKPIALAREMDIPRAATNFRFFATAILHSATEAHLTDSRAFNLTLREPRGVAALIAPWNLPLYLLSWKIAPALATGNTAVAKPSELTPATANLLAEVALAAGLPRGVLNIIHGTGDNAGAALISHDNVACISFTGGTTTGASIATATAPLFRPLTLELGGKNPTIVFADANFDAALEGTLRSGFSNQGEICLCGSRVLVERTCYDRFLTTLVERVAALRVGDPLEPTTDQGALISHSHREKVLSYIALAQEEGGTVHCGGRVPEILPARCQNGYFVEPAVVTGLTMGCRFNQEEVFGPVVSVTPFDSEEEAIGLANQSQYGLAASVWTTNLDRANRVARAVACGTIWVNCWLLRDLRVPFGGVGRSGLGREGGSAALEFFTETKNVCIKLQAPSSRGTMS